MIAATERTLQDAPYLQIVNKGVPRLTLNMMAAALRAADLAFLPIGVDGHPAIQSIDAYHLRPPREQEIKAWFDAGIVEGLALVLGGVNRLICVESTSRAGESAFLNEFISLYATHAEQTANGWRRRYRLPPDSAAPDTVQVADFGMLLGEGAIVPLSMEENSAAASVRTALQNTKTLTRDELERLIAFYAARQPQPDKGNPIDLIASETSNGIIAQTATRGASTPQTGALAEAITNDESVSSETQDSVKNGMAKAPKPRRGLPDTMREALLASGAVSTSRVLDVLLFLGWIEGRVFTEREAVEACKPYRISRKVVRAALGIFVPILNGEYCPIYSNGDKKEGASGRTRGRPRSSGKRYEFPAIAALAARLGVSVGEHSTELVPADFRGQKSYRAALHAALIRDRPGAYTLKLLSERIGTSKNTVRNYNRELGIVSEPQYKNIRITERNIEEELSDNLADMQMNVRLEIEVDHTAEYVPTRQMARILLNTGHSVTLIRRAANRYYFSPKRGRGKKSNA